MALNSHTNARFVMWIAGTLAVLWTLNLIMPWTWISAQNAMFVIHMNLWTVEFNHGPGSFGVSLLSKAVGAKKFGDALDGIMDNKIWMMEVTERFCAVGFNSLFHWCDEWTMLTFTSYVSMFMGVLTVIFLLMGIGFIYHYDFNHPTETGRKWMNASFILAPFVSVIGLTQYTLCTFSFGKYDYNPAMTPLVQMVDYYGMYGIGYMFSWFLTLLSFIPMYLVSFHRTAANEKKKDDEEGDNGLGTQDAAYATQTYGAAQSSLMQAAGSQQVCALGYQAPASYPVQDQVAGFAYQQQPYGLPQQPGQGLPQQGYMAAGTGQGYQAPASYPSQGFGYDYTQTSQAPAPAPAPAYQSPAPYGQPQW